MTDAEFLQWIHDRIVNVYGESENFDFLHHLRSVIQQLKETGMSEQAREDDTDAPMAAGEGGGRAKRSALHAHAQAVASSVYGAETDDLASSDTRVQVFVYENRGGQERRLVLSRTLVGTKAGGDGYTVHAWVACKEGEALPLGQGSFSLPDMSTARAVWRALGKLLDEQDPA